ncbi:MAG TPA: YihY/virulence factor BrkB family protein [Acidimicrobiales bacterium]|nr:YihY/virulence factor BrkB family protein [Acidimicrobiales bacterium]
MPQVEEQWRRHWAETIRQTGDGQAPGAPAASGPDGGRRRRVPRGPVELDRGSWTATLKRTVREFRQDHLVDWAAALAYYGVLAIFPALLALVSVLGVVGASATRPLLDNLSAIAPGPARDIVSTALIDLQEGPERAGLLVVVGFALALWSASGYVGAFMRASNAIYEIEEGRPIWWKGPLRLGVTLVLVVLLAVSAVAVVATGQIADRLGQLLGVGATAVTVWDIAKWPVLLVVVSLMFAILYWAAPNVEQPGWRWVSPGGLLAVVLWVLVSAVFAVYVANFGSYDKTYGTFGGVIVFLVWLWLSNIAILLGAELNAELQRARQMAAGVPADQEPFLEPRDTRAMKD